MTTRSETFNERVAILETEMKNVNKCVEDMRKEVNDLAKRVYMIVGGMSIVTIIIELGSKFIK